VPTTDTSYRRPHHRSGQQGENVFGIGWSLNENGVGAHVF